MGNLHSELWRKSFLGCIRFAPFCRREIVAQWGAGHLFAEDERWGKQLICDTLKNYDICDNRVQ